METAAFFEKLRDNLRPVVVDLWAPWCGPCVAVKPVLEKLSKEYEGRVDVWQINADESRELLQKLGVYGIPTLIVYRSGSEVMRYIGVKPAKAYRSMFETLATGGVPGPAALALADRLIRVGVGLAVAWTTWKTNSNALLFALGGVFLFSAVYDRCPIWRAITTKFKETRKRDTAKA